MKRVALALFSLCAGAFALGTGHAFAQSYPTKPVRLVVPFAPGGTPRDVVAQVNADFARVLGTPEVQERVRAWGYEPVGGTPEEFAAKYKADIGVYIKIIRDAKVPLVD